MYNEQVVDSPEKGTIYLISIAIPDREEEMPDRDYVQIRFGGEIRDELIIEKN